MKIYLPIAKVDAAQHMVYGYASTEARDDQGEVVKREALQDALGDYMKFGNIREMHQLSAVGKAKDATVDDKGLYLGAKVVDPDAWEKVKEGVYNGFSIGGKVLERAAGDPKTINKLRLDEISLVDRPANPEAVFDCWKRSAVADRSAQKSADDAQKSAGDPIAALKAAIERIEALVKGGDEPGDGSKPYGDVEYADPGYRDGKKRYPIDTEGHIRAAWNYIHKPKNAGEYSAEQLKHIKSKIISAWKDKIDPKGPPEADDEKKAAEIEMAKHLGDTGFIANTILQLDQLKDMLVMESEIEGDSSPQPARLGSIVDELCGFLNAMVAEETAEVRTDGEAAMPDSGIFMSAIASSLRKSGLAGRAQAFEALVKARHSAGDQALLDIAHHAAKKARGIDGLKKAETDHLDDCMECLKAAGAREWSADTGGSEEATQDTAHNAEHAAPTAKPPAQAYRPGVYTTWNSAEHTKAALELIEECLGKRGPFVKRSGAHLALMDVAHHALHKATDGAVCEAMKAGGGHRHSAETMANLREAHDHIVAAAGAECPGAGFMDGGKPGAEGEGEGAEEDKQDAARGGDLQKRYDALAASVAELAPRLDAILETVERIDRTPLPALTARSVEGLRRVEKGGPREADEDDEALMARISKMSPDEQAMLLVKAARRRPIVGTGPAPVMPPRAGA
jgi:HK97 family phage prohead protease